MKKVESLLFWSMILGFAVMFLWFGMIIFAGEAIHAFHTNLGTMPMMPLELFMQANYIGAGVWKMAVILLFAIPWLAMKIVGTEE